MRISNLVYPVRNNVSLIPPGQRPSGPAAAAGLDFRIILAGLNAQARISNGVYYLTLSLTSSSMTGTNADSMLFGLTNIEWVPSFVPRMMSLGSTLLTVNIFPLSMFLNISPAFIMASPLSGIVRVLNS